MARRRRNPSMPVRVRVTPSRRKAASKRRKPAKRRTMAKRHSMARRRRSSVRRRNPALDYKGLALQTLGLAGGVAAGKYLTDFVTDQVVKMAPNLKQEYIGAVQLAGAYGVLALAEYAKSMPELRNAPVDFIGSGLATFMVYNGLANIGVLGEAVKTAQAGANAQLPTQTGGSRRMLGTIKSSPKLARQLATSSAQMAGTRRLPMSGAMRGSLEVFPTPQASIAQMQGYHGKRSMRASMRTSCL